MSYARLSPALCVFCLLFLLRLLCFPAEPSFRVKLEADLTPQHQLENKDGKTETYIDTPMDIMYH